MEAMLRTALRGILGPVKNILDQLAGEKGEQWIEILGLMSRMTPERILKVLSTKVSDIYWKRIVVGGKTRKELFSMSGLDTDVEDGSNSDSYLP